MAARIQALPKEFDELCFELRDCPDVIVLEGKCQKCNYYITMDCEIQHYIKRSNLSSNTPLNGVICPNCNYDKSIIIPRL